MPNKRIMSNKRILFSRTAPALLAWLAFNGLPAVPAQAETAPIQLAQLFGSTKKRSKEAAELNVRVDGVEQEIRNLTGKLEELSFQLRQLQDLLRRMQEDAEFRFQELEGAGGAKRGSLQPRSKSMESTPSGNARAADPAQEHVLGTIPKSYADENAEAPGRQSSGPLDLSALARGTESGFVDGTQSEETMPSASLSAGEPSQDYETAYNMVLQGDYVTSEKMFKTFLSSYPDHHLAGNAQYWLGESLFARGLYRDAADAFLKSYSDYPGSSKGPDSLLKLGLSLAGLGEQAAACATYGELLSKFPGAPASVKKRATVESDVIGCAS